MVSRISRHKGERISNERSKLLYFRIFGRKRIRGSTFIHEQLRYILVKMQIESPATFWHFTRHKQFADFVLKFLKIPPSKLISNWAYIQNDIQIWFYDIFITATIKNQYKNSIKFLIFLIRFLKLFNLYFSDKLNILQNV